MTISVTISLPYFAIILVGVFIGLSLFYYTKQQNDINKENKRDKLEDKREDLLERLRGDKRAE